MAKKLPLFLLEADNTVMKKAVLMIAAGLLLLAMPAGAAPQQDHAGVRAAITDFVYAQLADFPGKVAVKIGEIDRRIVLAACPALEPFTPPGGRLLGNTTVGVRCVSGSSWTLFVPVQVKVNADLVVAIRPLQQGQVLRAEDLAIQNGELFHLGALTDPAQAVGKVLKFGVGAGQALKQNMLRTPYTVIQGQAVQIQVAGQGYRIQHEGQALSSAAEGQHLRVRTSSGQVISGMAQADGSVAVYP